ncbi:unnamed protein product [Schistosoma turkestanicum]|nr:unnamed protein product [Schistosoma turkestanicum]
MRTLTEITYAFINNNLQDTSKTSTATKYELIQNVTDKSICYSIKQSLSKRPSMKKLNSTTGVDLPSVCNSSNNYNCDGIPFTHNRSLNINNDDKKALRNQSLSRNSPISPTASQSSVVSLSSSSSSSSSRQLSPITTPRAPLLGTNHKRNLTTKSKTCRNRLEIDNILNQNTHNHCDRCGLKEQSKSGVCTYHCTNITHKLHSSPLSDLKMKAKRVWNVFERKIGNDSNKKICQSKSVGNLQYTSKLLNSSENSITNHNESDVKGSGLMPAKHQVQNQYPSATDPVSDKRISPSFPHSKSFEISKHPDCNKKLNTSLCNKHYCTNVQMNTDNNVDEKHVDKMCSMSTMPCQPISHCMNSYFHSENYTYCIYENITEKLANGFISEYYNNEQFQETCHRICLTSNKLDQLSNMKCAENCILILPTGLPFTEVREISVTRPEVGKRFGVRIEKCGKGTYLTTVLPGSVASQSGLKIGDEILQLNGIAVQPISINTINQLVRSANQLKITYRPRTMLAKIRLIIVKKIDGRVGIRLKKIAEGLYVDVVLPNSAAYEAGIKEGDELICVNNQIVTNWTQEAASKLLRELPDEDILMLYFREFFHPHGFKDVIHFTKQLKTISMKESLSMPHCSTMEMNSSSTEFNCDEKPIIDESFSLIDNTFNVTSYPSVKKQYVPLNFQDTLEHNTYVDYNNSPIRTSNVSLLNHSRISYDDPVTNTLFEMIPQQSHKRILNSFSDYTLDCPKCFINEQQIQ